jgi:hypothetical protein
MCLKGALADSAEPELCVPMREYLQHGEFRLRSLRGLTQPGRRPISAVLQVLRLL